VGASAVALTALALLLVHGISLPRPAHLPEQRRPAGSSPRDAQPAVRRTAAAAIGAVAAVNAVVAATTLALLPVAERAWHESDSGYGVATAALGFGALAGPLLWWLGSTAARRCRLGMVACGAMLAGVAAAPGLWWAIPVLVVLGAAAVRVEGAVTETLQDAVPDERRAGVLGLADSVMVAAALLASLVTPWLTGRVGPTALLVAMAVGCAVVGTAPQREAQRLAESSTARAGSG
jgi:MFS family permease